MKKITGGGIWVTIWTLGLTTLAIGKSIFSKNASVAINGIGRASWENKEPSKPKAAVKASPAKSKDESSLVDLEKFYAKFYEV